MTNLTDCIVHVFTFWISSGRDSDCDFWSVLVLQKLAQLPFLFTKMSFLVPSPNFSFLSITLLLFPCSSPSPSPPLCHVHLLYVFQPPGALIITLSPHRPFNLLAHPSTPLLWSPFHPSPHLSTCQAFPCVCVSNHICSIPAMFCLRSHTCATQYRLCFGVGMCSACCPPFISVRSFTRMCVCVCTWGYSHTVMCMKTFRLGRSKARLAPSVLHLPVAMETGYPLCVTCAHVWSGFLLIF